LIFAVLVLRVNDCRPYTPFKLLSFFSINICCFYSFIITLSHLRYCDSAFQNLIMFNICGSTPNLVKILTIFSVRYFDLTIFKMADVRHLRFGKFAAFVMWPLLACRSASWCKISLMSMSYGKKNDFQDGGRRHLEL